MQSKILEGVKPFNDFWFKSCYYHQLIAGVSVLGIDGKDILLNDFAYFGEDFAVENSGLLNEKALSKAVGYKIIRKNINEKFLIKCIDKGKPIIIGVDCYYLESRAETYKKLHTSHFLLVYGYDLEKREVNVVDHNYINSYLFVEKIVSLDNILAANYEYQKGICKAKTTSMVLLKRKNSTECDFLNLVINNKQKLFYSKQNITNDMNKLKEIFISGEESIKNSYEKIIAFVEKAQASRVHLSKTGILELDNGIKNILDELISCYTFFTALLWKSSHLKDFKFCEERLDKIIRKIDKIQELENSFYQRLLEVTL